MKRLRHTGIKKHGVEPTGKEPGYGAFSACCGSVNCDNKFGHLY